MDNEKEKSEAAEKLDILRHSAAHVMAEAVQSMFPDAKFGIGPTIEDLCSSGGIGYPAPATAGTGTDITLAAYFQGGAWGTVPRPEITGNDMAALIYWVRRTGLPGTWPTNPVPATPGSAATPVISAVSASRVSSTSITVNWTTDQATLGYACAGSPHSAGSSAPYNCWEGGVESTYGTSHSVTLTSLPTTTPTHFAIFVRNATGISETTGDNTIS